MADPTCKVEYHGIKISREYLKNIEEAQKLRQVTIHGKLYDRIPFGKETKDWGTNKGFCGDCSVALDAYHVPGCDIERCPSCMGQMISCGCR